MKRLLVVVVAVAAGLGACGSGGEERAGGGAEDSIADVEEQKAAAEQAGDKPAGDGDVKKYCEVTKRLDAAGDALMNTEAETAEDVKAGFARLMEANAADFDELVRWAPAEIRDQVAAAVAAFRKAAEGDFAGVAEIDTAEVDAFEQANCT